MRDRWTTILAVFVLGGFCALCAQEKPQGKSKESFPAAKASKQVAATVGDKTITNAEVDRILLNFPEEERENKRKRVLEELVFQLLVREYVKANDVHYTDEDLAEVKQRVARMAAESSMKPEEMMEKSGFTKEDLEDSARSIRLRKNATTPERVKAFIQAHPNYFDGTKVRARHILISCNPLASSRQQISAKQKLQRLRVALRAGTTTFENAARRYSSCPSKQKGGDLGEFGFGQMLATFAMAAFDTEKDHLSEIVRTRHGFHLILVTDRTKGKEMSQEDAEEAARTALVADLQNRLFNQTLTTTPIVFSDEGWDAAKPKAPAPDSKTVRKTEKPEPIRKAKPPQAPQP
jgi:parvulin-like peptidyl-prolyl isomerase